MIAHHCCGLKVFAILIPPLLFGCATAPTMNPPQSPTPPVSEDPPRSRVMEPTPQAIASMGEVQLDITEFQDYLNRLPAQVKNRLLADPEALEMRIQREMVRKYLVMQAFGDEDSSHVNALRKKKLAEEEVLRSRYLAAITAPQPSYPDQATLKRRYQEMLERSDNATQVHLRHIFVPYNDNRVAAQVKCQALLAMTKKSQADFATLARKLSMDPATAPQGGDMGVIALTSLPASFQEALKEADDGAIIGPVEDDKGYHILQKLTEHSKPTPGFGEIAPTLAVHLRQQQAQENLQKNLERWRETNPIVMHPDGLALFSQRYTNLASLN